MSFHFRINTETNNKSDLNYLGILVFLQTYNNSCKSSVLFSNFIIIIKSMHVLFSFTFLILIPRNKVWNVSMSIIISSTLCLINFRIDLYGIFVQASIKCVNTLYFKFSCVWNAVLRFYDVVILVWYNEKTNTMKFLNVVILIICNLCVYNGSALLISVINE